MARISRSQAAAAAALRTPTPNEPSDPESVATPLPEESHDDDDELEQDHGNAGNADDAEDTASHGPDSADESAPATPGQSRSAGRRRRGGRTRGSAARRDARSQDARGHESDNTTPRRRGGWRGRGFGAGRWAKLKGGLAHATQWPVDKEGNSATIVNDEVELSEDPEGEQKVDKDGQLSGGREYRVRTFKIQGKGERLYMLSTEPARCIGFRDSYLFFQKHKQLYKIIVEEDAKKDLIERGLIPHSYKGRHIGVVTARSVFREFGAKILVGGKKVVDDYNVAEARDRGDVEGEFAVPEDEVPRGLENYDRNRYVAWHGASNVYHTGTPNMPIINGKPSEAKRRKVMVTGANWMSEHALQASRFNSHLTFQRRQTLNGVYDIHTNVMQYPKIMQPTRMRWEHVPSQDLQDEMSRTVNRDAECEEKDLRLRRVAMKDHPQRSRFMVVDTHFQTPPMSTPEAYELGSDLAETRFFEPTKSFAEVIAGGLPADCRDALHRACAQERQWKRKWGREGESAMRAKIRVTYNV